MWLKLIHLIGLTNLSNRQVQHYEKLHHEKAEYEGEGFFVDIIAPEK